jgi:hypothetical protein
MKTIKFFTFCLMILVITPIISQAQNNIEKTLSKSFNLQGKTTLRIDIANVEVKTWNEPIARIEMTIACENMSEAMLKSLITAGRYNVQSAVETEILVLNAPGMQKTVKLNGQELKETIKYVLNVPKDVNVINTNGVSKVNGKGNTSLK